MSNITKLSKSGCLKHFQNHINIGTDLNEKDYAGRTALMYCAYNKHNKALVLLVDSGADVNIQDNKGMSALMYARNYVTVKCLIDNGADISHVDKYKRTVRQVIESRNIHGVEWKKIKQII